MINHSDQTNATGLKVSVKRLVLKAGRANPPALALLCFGLLAASIYWVEAAKLGWVGDVVFFLSTAIIFTGFGYLFAGLKAADKIISGLDNADISADLKARALNGELTTGVLVSEFLLANRQFSLLEQHYQDISHRLSCLESSIGGFVFMGYVQSDGTFKPTQLSDNIERHFALKRTSVLEDWGQLYSLIDARDRVAVIAVISRPTSFPEKEEITFGLQRAAHESISYYRLAVSRRATNQGIAIFGVIIDVTESALAIKQAKSDDKAKSEFLATVSHELRTPLNAIIGFSRLLVSQLRENADARSDAQNVVSAGESLLVILNDILDYSRISAEGMKLNNAPFELNTLVQGLFDLNESTAQAKGIEFKLNNTLGGDLVLLGDVNRLRQVLQNLISNALKFTEAGYVELAVGCGAKDGHRMAINFRVSDSGIGISRSELERLFTRFSQANRETNRRFGGTGLGLAISKGLIELMGGRIDVTSEPGVGSVFEVSLNLAVTQRPVAVDITPDEPTQSLRILGVDDHPLNLKLLNKYLSKKGHSFDEATSAKQAIDMADKSQYDLILMDIDMPEMDGHEATKQLRTQSKLNSNTFICALSGLADEASIAKSKSVGMNDHLTKPVSFDALNKLLQLIAANHVLERQ